MDAPVEEELSHWESWWRPQLMGFLTKINPQMKFLSDLGWTSDDIFDKFEEEYIEFCSKGKEEYKDYLFDEYNNGNISYGEMYRRILEIESVKPQEL